MSNERLLIIDDDIELCNLLQDYLAHEGYRVEASHSAEEALVRLNEQNEWDLLILDIQMPGASGLELLQQLRPRLRTPVIMLTGRGDEIDRILGLEMGADDYLGKPCNPRELLARVRAVLRRAGPDVVVEPRLFPEQVIERSGIQLDPGLREVRVNGVQVELTSAEFNVLAYLIHNAGRVMSKEQLTELVLHRKLTAYDRALDVHVSRVRQKLGPLLQEGVEPIKTIRGQGYQFVKDRA
ncbi:Copper-sensing two-component system response regulator CpxR [Marinobacterium lacunae]|uniref:Copper-sensing two-component system response regulator CpxR n=1 Tax=Marinobacterium lacunae TaxID=1232683 RepID=A0A081FYG6_9GAMM|nr:response regulator transcription factor [Marinobacterium lacunae]KEA63571.1 Copper-sensing two-component system response regulator CpxR [Marinobacterium lacunae]MBR9884595.1 response regulator transcription factor [Oceanospirillales bacterium]